MKKYLLFNFLIFFSYAQSGIEIAKMVDLRKIPKDQSNITKMVLTNSKGKQRTNIVRSKSMDGNKKQIMWFMEPRDDKGVAFLKIENDGKDDEMRMWLPAFKKVRRISSKKRGDSFMGSDLSYEDLSNRKIADHDYSRLDDQTLNSKLCYVLEISPKKGA
ncbi:MAG: outer membrane lipoprotein-sorting protein, partial [Candidatus Marinimicrobia bacterium]|nr:outer membrane lipoprotein-sorting protein [Candidatus Neomarinimicrobiota bacterium]